MYPYIKKKYFIVDMTFYIYYIFIYKRINNPHFLKENTNLFDLYLKYKLMRKWFYSLLKDQQPITYQTFIQYSIVEVNVLNAGFY